MGEPAARPSVLLFDLGGVLVEITAFEALRAMLGEALDDDEVRERWLRSPAVRSFELGRVSPAVFASRFISEWRVALTPEAFLEDFGTWIKRPYAGAEALISSLRRKYRVSCLSNCNEVHWTAMAPLLTSFDSAFSSHLLGEIKPDRAVFEKVMGELQVEPGQLWFFDDALLNVQAAESLGIKAFQVQGIEGTTSVLRREGLV
jgi:HAD superfamily hydrolase (TIGR01509 family)